MKFGVKFEKLGKWKKWKARGGSHNKICKHFNNIFQDFIFI